MAEGSTNGNGNGNGFATFLRDAGKYILAAMVGVVGWNLNAVINHGDRITSLETQMELRTKNRYTSEDATRDMKYLDQRISDDESRIQSLERANDARAK